MQVTFKKLKKAGHLAKAYCHPGCKTLSIYYPKLNDKVDTLYEIGGVIGQRSVWQKVFKKVGLL